MIHCNLQGARPRAQVHWLLSSARQDLGLKHDHHALMLRKLERLEEAEETIKRQGTETELQLAQREKEIMQAQVRGEEPGAPKFAAVRQLV